MALLATSASQLVDLVATGIHRADKPTPPPSGTLFPSLGGNRLPSLQGNPQREPIKLPPHDVSILKEDEPTLQVAPIP